MGTKNSINSDMPIDVPSGGTGATSLTDHSVLVGSGSSAITSLSSMTDGQLVIGNTGSDPSIAALTSSGGSVEITNGSGTINLEAISASSTCAFGSYADTAASNVTGAGTEYHIKCDGEYYDNGSDYNTTTGNFYAPVDGSYIFSGVISMYITSGGTSMYVRLRTSNSTFMVYRVDPTDIATGGTIISLNFSQSCYMDAGDYSYFSVGISNGSGNVDDLYASGNPVYPGTTFSGSLIG